MDIITAPKGTKDILPVQTYRWKYVEEVFRKICETYGFSEIRTPIFEHTEVFKRGIGDSTDVVEKQMYSFKDYAGRDITLKPEGTSPVVRAFIESKLYADAQISKLYYVTPCFRYEKPQAGRQRQFHQFGVESLGTDSPVADAEIIAIGMDLFERLGVTDLELHINSIGCKDCRKEYRRELKSFFDERRSALCDTCNDRLERNPMRILDCKSQICKETAESAPRILDYICDDCKEDFEKLQEALLAMGIQFKIDPDIVRGLDYYTKTAFEIITTRIGAQGTVCGGGRYNGLVEELGGPATPAVGFGLGIERLLLVMESFGADIPKKEGIDIFFAIQGQRAMQYGLGLMRTVRRAGYVADMDLLGRSFKNQFKYADKLCARFAAVIGEDEIDNQTITVKDMQKKTQEEIKKESILDYLGQKFK